MKINNVVVPSSSNVGDVLLGKVDHNGDLGSQAIYSATLTTSLPPLKDGS